MTAALLAAALAAGSAGALALAVPIVRQRPERCGPAALLMVVRYHGAPVAAEAEVERAYDPALRGALITDLAAAARRAGFHAEVAVAPPDSLPAWLARGVPPILLIARGRTTPCWWAGTRRATG
jgi:ABC-type bacteriocin/lantibiotic exporter with double-glycine peptidase domain